MKNKILKFFKKQFRFVIVDSESLEEKKTVSLTRINFYAIALFLCLCFFIVSFIIIVYSPINQYLPGKSSDLVQNELYLQTDRKEKALERLKVLETCNCEEYQELKDLIEGKKESKY